MLSRERRTMSELSPTLPVLGLLDGREQSNAKRRKVVLNRGQPGVARAPPGSLPPPRWNKSTIKPELVISATGTYELIAHDRHTEGMIELNVNHGLSVLAVCFTPGLAPPVGLNRPRRLSRPLARQPQAAPCGGLQAAHPAAAGRADNLACLLGHPAGLLEGRTAQQQLDVGVGAAELVGLPSAPVAWWTARSRRSGICLLGSRVKLTYTASRYSRSAMPADRRRARPSGC